MNPFCSHSSPATVPSEPQIETHPTLRSREGTGLPVPRGQRGWGLEENGPVPGSGVSLCHTPAAGLSMGVHR